MFRALKSFEIRWWRTWYDLFKFKLNYYIKLSYIAISYEIFFFKFSGGTPPTLPISNLTINKFSLSFSGCLQDIAFGSDPQVYRIEDYSQYEGENIGACELYDEFNN